MKGMSSTNQVPHEELMEKKYSYRPSALMAYGVIFAGLIYTGVVTWWLIRDKEPAYFLGLSCSLFMVLVGIYMAVWRIRNKSSLTISEEGVCLPSDRIFVPFSKITEVCFRGDAVNRIFCVRVGKKSYEIHSMFLESSDDFEEIMAVIQAHMPPHLKRISQ
jgi:hypothetical protein